MTEIRERFEREIRQNFQHLEDGLSSEMYDGQDSPLVADMFRLYSAATAGQQELIEALREAEGIIVWMSGYDDFAPEGKAGKGWNIARKKLNKIRAVLARYGKLEGRGTK